MTFFERVLLLLRIMNFSVLNHWRVNWSAHFKTTSFIFIMHASGLVLATYYSYVLCRRHFDTKECARSDFSIDTARFVSVPFNLIWYYFYSIFATLQLHNSFYASPRGLYLIYSLYILWIITYKIITLCARDICISLKLIVYFFILYDFFWEFILSEFFILFYSSYFLPHFRRTFHMPSACQYLLLQVCPFEY